jgi:hypothetical protein
MTSERLQPAFWGGLFIGVLSALPIVNVGNCCCCLWVLMGGALAAYLRQQNMPHQMNPSESALVGLMAGIVGAIVGALISIPLQMVAGGFQREWMERALESNPDVPAEFRDLMRQLATGPSMMVIGLLVSLVINTIFGMLGGLIGFAIFKKNVPPPPPPGTIDVSPVPPASTL